MIARFSIIPKVFNLVMRMDGPKIVEVDVGERDLITREIWRAKSAKVVNILSTGLCLLV